MSRPTDLARLLAELDPEADLPHRHLWLIHLLEWVRGDRDSVPGATARLQLFLDAVEARPELRARLQAWWAQLVDTVDITTLLADFGFAPRTAFVSELAARLRTKWLPGTPDTIDASELFVLAVPHEFDAQWMAALDEAQLNRLAALLVPPGEESGISLWRHALLNAITYCAGQILSTGFAPELRLRMSEEAREAQPFHALIRDVESLRVEVLHALRTPDRLNEAAQRLRERLEACRAATATVYTHFEDNGISVGLVFRLRQLRAKHLYALFLLLIRRAVLLRLRETRERRRERLPADESALLLLMRQPQGCGSFSAGGERLLSLRERCRKLLRRGGLRLREQLRLLRPAVPCPRREIERTLLQPFLEGCIPLRVEERLHELAAPPGIAHEKRTELSLRQQHDLSELLAAKARQRLEILRHLARAGDEQFLLAAALRVELRPRPRRALPVLAPIGRTAQHAVAARAEREFQLHPGLCLRRRLVRAQHRTRAQRAARLAIERKADRVEQRRLPRAVGPGEHRDETGLEDGGEVVGPRAVAAADTQEVPA